MNRLLYLLPVLLLAVAGCASFEDEEWDARKADITLPELIKKMKAFNDPKGLCVKAKSYVLRQQLINDKEEDIEHERVVEVKFQKKPYFTKTTNIVDGKANVETLFDGVNAWSIAPASGISTRLTGIQLKMIQTLGKISNPAYSYSDIFSDIELRQVFSGTKEYYRLVCSSSSDSEIPPLTVFVDKNSFQTRKVMVDFITPEGETINYVSYINEYAMFSDVMMPAVITAVVNGVKSQYRISEFKLNVVFSPKEFELPTPWYVHQGAAVKDSTRKK